MADINTIKEYNGRYLAWIEEPKIALYGDSKEEAIEKVLQTIEECKEDITKEDFSCILPSDNWYGTYLLDLVSRWTGISKEEFIQSYSQSLN